MKKNYRIKNSLAAFMAAFILSVSLLTPAINAKAASTVNVSSETLYDIALAKVGIHASNSLLSRLINSHINALTGTAQSYWGYCKTEGLEKNAESWSAYVNSSSYATPTMQIVSWIQQTKSFLEWCWTHDETDFLGSDLVNAVLGKDTAFSGESYKLDDELVESIHDDFQTFIQTEGIGFYYVPIRTEKDLDISLFYNKESYDNFVSYVENSEYNTYSLIYEGSFGNSEWYIPNNSNDIPYMVRPWGDYELLSFYDENWQSLKVKYTYFYYNATLPTDMVTNGYDRSNNSFKVYLNRLLTDGNGGSLGMFFIGKELGRKIVFTDETAMKEYSVGIRPYYATTNNIYDSSVDNSVEVTGDYLVNNGGSLSYDTIYNQIQEGNVTTDNSINEIVNSNNQTIINNYYYTEDSGDSGSGDSGSGSFGDGIASFFEGLKSILDFLLGIIGDLATTLTSFLGSVYDLIKNIGGQFTGFSQLLGELFVFIPQEIIDLLTAGIGVIIVVCIVKWLKG